jgi:choline dehydrogenase-like flavoprotein
MKSFEYIIIGSGQGGTPLASALAGKRTALVESIHAGGTCVNEGCTPAAAHPAIPPPTTKMSTFLRIFRLFTVTPL